MLPEARKHHFVPKLLLRPWVQKNSANQNVLCGYYWNKRRNLLEKKCRGLDGFCFQLDLLTLKSHKMGRDVIERIFFGEIDTKGAIARDIALNSGPEFLTHAQRCDFARLLISLEVRRPVIVDKLRNAGTAVYKANIDSDKEILAAMADAGITASPSAYYEQQTGASFEDIGITTIQKLVDNPRIGAKLVNAHWFVKHLRNNDGNFMLSDRPLIRIRSYDHPGAAWILPLTPKAVFIATNHENNLIRLKNVTPQRIVKLINPLSARQAERFVFSTEKSYPGWLGKHLSLKS